MINDEDLRGLCRSLSGAIKSGLPLTAAFENLAKSPEHGKRLSAVAAMTASGTALHAAFAAQHAFPPVFTALLRAGEEGGKTEEFLDLYADSLDVRIDFSRRMERVMIYPAAAAILAGALFIFITLKAVPQILGPLQAAGAAAPEAEKLAALTAAFAANWHLILAGAVLGLLLLRFLLRCGPARRLFSLAAHWLPLFRYATEHARLYYAYTTMGLLMKAGFPLGAMMDVLLQLEDEDPILKWRFTRAAAALAGGKSFCAGLHGFFPGDEAQTMEIAEKAGRMDETLLRLAKGHRDLHLHRLKKLVTFATLAVTVAIALMCFLLLVSVIRPVFSALSSAGTVQTDNRAPMTPSEETEDSIIARLQRVAQSQDLEIDTRTAAFNQAYGGIIANFIRKHGVSPGEPESGQPAAGSATERAGNGDYVNQAPPQPIPASQAVRTSAVKTPAVSAPQPLPRLTPRSGRIGSTPIRPTDIGPGR